MSAETIAGQTMLVTFHGSRASGDDAEAARCCFGSAAGFELHRGGKSRRRGSNSVENEAEEELTVQPRQDGIAALVRKAVEVAEGLPALEGELSGKGLARYRLTSSARFQSLPIGTVRADFPHTARPVSFI